MTEYRFFDLTFLYFTSVKKSTHVQVDENFIYCLKFQGQNVPIQGQSGALYIGFMAI